MLIYGSLVVPQAKFLKIKDTGWQKRAFFILEMNYLGFEEFSFDM